MREVFENYLRNWSEFSHSELQLIRATSPEAGRNSNHLLRDLRFLSNLNVAPLRDLIPQWAV